MMEEEIKKYENKKLVIFSIKIEQRENPKKIFKKCIMFPKKWHEYNLNKKYINYTLNGIALLTGKINNLIIIDIDNVNHWEQLLKENKKKEPKTVKVITGSGGIHFYFSYDENLEEIKSKDHCFGKNYDIDIKTNGGCVICPYSSYFNKKLNKNVEYKWEKSIFEHKPSKIPKWIKKLLLDKRDDANES